MYYFNQLNAKNPFTSYGAVTYYSYQHLSSTGQSLEYSGALSLKEYRKVSHSSLIHCL
jgi:hypothetical protein